MAVPEDLPFPKDLGRHGHQGRNTARWPDCRHIFGCDSDERADADTAYMRC